MSEQGVQFVKKIKGAVRPILPTSVLNWRAKAYYGRYGEKELHLVRILCKPSQDSIDVGANDGCYIYFMRKHSRRVYAFEPIPWLAQNLERRFGKNVVVQQIALSSSRGSAVLKMPIIHGTVVTGCSTLSSGAAAQFSDDQEIGVPTDTLDNIYRGEVGFIKIDVEGHEEAVLAGARLTIERSRPSMLIELIEQYAPGIMGRVTEYCRQLGYRGYFVSQRALHPIEQFDHRTMQNAENRPDLLASLDQHERSGYIDNFLFLPDDLPARTLRALEAQAARL